MAKKLAIVVSDLHLGRGNAQDDFEADLEWEEFCKEINQYALHNDLDLTLVLNGDILDLWEIVPDAQLEVDGFDEIKRHLFFPLTGDSERQRMVDFGMWQVEAALNAHPFFAAGVARVLGRARNRVVYVPGNHDHAMVSPGMQQALRDAINSIVMTRFGDRLEFANFYEDPDLKLYCEHGSQFSDGDSDYKDFPSDVDEATGYYFLRFVWNRIQARSRKPISDVFNTLLRWLLTEVLLHDKPDLTQVKFLLQYFRAHQDGFVPKLVPQAAIPAMYDYWDRKHGTLRATYAIAKALASVFRKNHREGERTFERRSGSDDPGGPYPIRNIGISGRQTDAFLESKLVDGYWEGIMNRYSEARGGFKKLSHRDHATVFLGHTHRKQLWELPVKNGKGVRYWNEGTWTKDHPYTYGWVTNDGNPLEYRGLKVYPKA